MAPIERLRFEALGSSCELLSVGGPRQLLESGAGWVLEMHGRLTRFDRSSELCAFNRGAGRWQPLSPELEALLRAALKAHRASGGLVHAAVLHQLEAAGYTRPLRLGPTVVTLAEPQPMPPLDEVLELRRGRGRLRPGWGVDLGGLAKGWLADRLCPRLGDSAVANLGGDLFAAGPGPDGQGWPVGLGEVTVLLRDMGAATSGTRRRAWVGAHHLIDPRTGLPARSDLEEVSVVASSALLAEELAKTALLLGRRDAPAHLASRALGWRLA